MTESKSTDKLMALSIIVEKTLDKLPADKISKIKSLDIKWLDLSDGYYSSDSN